MKSSNIKNGPCTLCGNIAELAPFGDNGEMICLPCGLKNRNNLTQNILKSYGKTDDYPNAIVIDCPICDFSFLSLRFGAQWCPRCNTALERMIAFCNADEGEA